MARVVRRRNPPPAVEEPRNCDNCGMPASVRYKNRTDQRIALCDRDEERFKEALRKAEYTRES